MGTQDRSYWRDSPPPGGFSGDPAGGILRALNWSFPIGRVLGITVRVHITFVLLVIIRLLSERDPAWTLRWTGLLFASVLLHEFGHCLACRRVRGEADEILMWPLGGLASCRPPRQPWPEFVTVIWGPLVNVILALAAYVTLLAWFAHDMPVSLNPFFIWAHRPPGVAAGLVADLFAVNYMLLLFNMALVFYPFDGGRLVQIGLWTIMGYGRSMRLACSMGMGGAVLAALVAIVWSHMLLLLIGVFGFIACYRQRLALRDIDDLSLEFESYAVGPQRQPRGSVWSRWKAGRAERRRRREAENIRRQNELVDRILDKIHHQGLGSLTTREKRILQQRSRRG
jgi:stage IV sporulation protein FB